jgi:hypothetical protein
MLRGPTDHQPGAPSANGDNGPAAPTKAAVTVTKRGARCEGPRGRGPSSSPNGAHGGGEAFRVGRVRSPASIT